jgi:hypothetical protein
LIEGNGVRFIHLNKNWGQGLTIIERTKDKGWKSEANDIRDKEIGRMEYWNTGIMEIIKVAGYKLTPYE